MSLANRKNPKGFRPIPTDDRPGKSAAAESARQVEPLDPKAVPRYAGRAKVATDATFSAAGRGRRKADFERPRIGRTTAAEGPLELAPMQPPRVDSRSAARHAESMSEGEAYVRMRIVVDGDSLRVLDSHLVDGPLREGDTFPGRYAYDVTVGGEFIHAGPAPDLGERRSFVAPDAEGEERLHHITQADTTIFTARVPAEALTPARLSDIEIRLFRLKEEASGNSAREDLPSRFPQSVRVLASRTGLPRSVLPAEIRKRAARGR
jgi:hypothetical protein